MLSRSMMTDRHIDIITDKGQINRYHSCKLQKVCKQKSGLQKNPLQTKKEIK